MPEPQNADVDDGLDQSSPGDSGNRFQVLGYEQVNRLHRLMDTGVPIHGRGNFPTLQIKLRELVQVVRNRLKEEDITVRDIRLNGGAASFILGNETSEVLYNSAYYCIYIGVDCSVTVAVPVYDQSHPQPLASVPVCLYDPFIVVFLPGGLR